MPAVKASSWALRGSFSPTPIARANRARAEAVLPEGVQPEPGNALQVDLRKDLGREDQRPHGVVAQQRDRVLGAGHAPRQAEKGRVDQLEDLGRHAEVARDEVPDLAEGRVGRLDLRQDLGVERRQARQRLQAGQKRLEPAVVQQLAQRGRPGERELQGVRVAGLGQELVGAVHRAEREVPVHLPREHDARHVGIAVHHRGEQRGTVHLRHAQVAHHGVERLALEQPERFGRAARKAHVPVLALRPQHALQPLEHQRFVVHEHHGKAPVRGRHTSPACSPIGRPIVNVVPRPGSESKDTRPPCWSTMTG